jgi:hypothetical protein
VFARRIETTYFQFYIFLIMLVSIRPSQQTLRVTQPAESFFPVIDLRAL